MTSTNTPLTMALPLCMQRLYITRRSLKVSEDGTTTIRKEALRRPMAPRDK